MPEEISEDPVGYDIIAHAQPPELLQNSKTVELPLQEVRRRMVGVYDRLKREMPSADPTTFQPYIDFYLGGLGLHANELTVDKIDYGSRIKSARLQHQQARHILYGAYVSSDTAYIDNIQQNMLLQENLARCSPDREALNMFYTGVLSEVAVAKLFRNSGCEVYLPSLEGDEIEKLDVKKGIDMITVKVDEEGRSHVFLVDAKGKGRDESKGGMKMNVTFDISSIDKEDWKGLPQEVKDFLDTVDYGNGVKVYKGSVIVPTHPEMLMNMREATQKYAHEGPKKVLGAYGSLSSSKQEEFSKKIESMTTGNEKEEDT